LHRLRTGDPVALDRSSDAVEIAFERGDAGERLIAIGGERAHGLGQTPGVFRGLARSSVEFRGGTGPWPELAWPEDAWFEAAWFEAAWLEAAWLEAAWPDAACPKVPWPELIEAACRSDPAFE
jgi:hypothetical protein